MLVDFCFHANQTLPLVSLLALCICCYNKTCLFWLSSFRYNSSECVWWFAILAPQSSVGWQPGWQMVACLQGLDSYRASNTANTDNWVEEDAAWPRMLIFIVSLCGSFSLFLFSLYFLVLFFPLILTLPIQRHLRFSHPLNFVLFLLRLFSSAFFWEKSSEK